MTKKTVLITILIGMLAACASLPDASSPSVTPTVVLVYSPENLAYAKSAADKITVWLDIYTEFNTYHQKAVEQKKIFKSKNWQDVILSTLDKLSAATLDVSGISEVPADMQPIHNGIMVSMNDANEMIRMYKEFIKSSDLTMLEDLDVQSEKVLVELRIATDALQPYLAKIVK